MAPRLSGQTSIFGGVFFVSKSLLGIVRQKKLKIFTIFTRKPRSHVGILIHRTLDGTDMTKNGKCVNIATAERVKLSEKSSFVVKRKTFTPFCCEMPLIIIFYPLSRFVVIIKT